MKRTVSVILSVASIFSVLMAGCQNNNTSPSSQGTSLESVAVHDSKYSDRSNWVYFETDVEDTKADVFFVPAGAYNVPDDTTYNMPLTDTATKEKIKSTTTGLKGIYEENSRFFAPFYSQMSSNVYMMDQKITQKHLAIAFEDVKEAFEYYMQNCNNGRPIILAGFSQGSDMIIRLLQECFTSQERQDQLVACYAIGWRLTQEELVHYPHLKFATGESDTGVIVSFNSEAEYVKNSFVVPAGVKTLAINPLNWKTDSTPADKSLNIASAIMNYSTGEVEKIPQLTGAYIDGERGTLKVTDVDADDDILKNSLKIFAKGVYHEYDCQFFAGNLKKNVQTRLEAFLQNR